MRNKGEHIFAKLLSYQLRAAKHSAQFFNPPLTYIVCTPTVFSVFCLMPPVIDYCEGAFKFQGLIFLQNVKIYIQPSPFTLILHLPINFNGRNYKILISMYGKKNLKKKNFFYYAKSKVLLKSSQLNFFLCWCIMPIYIHRVLYNHNMVF